MSSILYYSNYCQHSKKIIGVLSKSEIQNEIHFICIDKREKGPNGDTVIVLENNQKVILHSSVTRVPALLLLNNNYKVLFGDEILQFLRVDIAQNDNSSPKILQKWPATSTNPSASPWCWRRLQRSA